MAGLALAQLHVVGELEQLARIAAPVGDVAGVDEQPHVPAPRRGTRDGLGRVHDRARPRLEQRGGRGAPPAHRALPHAVAVALGAGRRAPRVDRLRERGRAPDRQRERAGSVSSERIDVREAVGLRGPRGRASAMSRHGRAYDRRRRRPAATAAAERRRLTSPSTWASPCRPAAGAGRGSCRTSPRPRRRVQPPSFHIHAICFGCWKIVYAYSVRPRIWPFTCAGVLRREERDERRVQRRVLLGRRLLARPLEQRGGHAGRAGRRDRVHRDAVAAELDRPDERHAHDRRPWPRRSSSARSCRAARPTT